MLRLVEILAAAFGPDSGDAPFRALAHRLLSLFPAETGSYGSAPFRFTSERYLLPLGRRCGWLICNCTSCTSPHT